MCLLSDSVHSKQHDDLGLVFKCTSYLIPELEGAEASATVMVTLRRAAQSLITIVRRVALVLI